MIRRMVVDNKATITFVELLKEDLAIFRVVPDDGKVPEFRAGQFITIVIPNPAEVKKSAIKAVIDIGDKIPPKEINEISKEKDEELEKLLVLAKQN